MKAVSPFILSLHLPTAASSSDSIIQCVCVRDLCLWWNGEMASHAEKSAQWLFVSFLRIRAVLRACVAYSPDYPVSLVYRCCQPNRHRRKCIRFPSLLRYSHLYLFLMSFKSIMYVCGVCGVLYPAYNSSNFTFRRSIFLRALARIWLEIWTGLIFRSSAYAGKWNLDSYLATTGRRSITPASIITQQQEIIGQIQWPISSWPNIAAVVYTACTIRHAARVLTFVFAAGFKQPSWIRQNAIQSYYRYIIADNYNERGSLVSHQTLFSQ